jgi:preprotein translocase subunit SecE
MNHKPCTEEREIIQWPNEPQAMNRRKTDNTMTVLFVFLLFMACGSFGHCIISLSSAHGLWFIWPLYYLSFFYSLLVVHLTIVLSVFLLFMTCGSFGHCIICLSSGHDLWFIWPLYYLSFFCAWLERQIIQ